jgi:hypothetical protein
MGVVGASPASDGFDGAFYARMAWISGPAPRMFITLLSSLNKICELV